MKICIYCGSENNDNSAKCTSCGASEFKYHCANCGTDFSEGMYCPRCGVKAGQKPKICPNCGNTYFTNACPNCGHMGGAGNGQFQTSGNFQDQPVTNRMYTQNNPVNNGNVVTGKYENQPVVKKNGNYIWLWILGWLFCFPIPVTILIAKSKLSGVVKGILIAAVWLLYAGFVNS